MKINPDNFMLGNFELSEKFVVLIAGNEDSYISAIERKVRNHYYKKNKSIIEEIEKIDDYVEANDMFGQKKILKIHSLEGFSDKKIENILRHENGIIFSGTKLKLNKNTKDSFEKKEGYYIFMCYTLLRENKINYLKKYKENYWPDLDSKAFWFLVDILDNRFGIFNNELEKLTNFNSEEINLENINKIISETNNPDIEKIIFSIHLNNSQIIKFYNSTIVDNGDLFFLISRIKFFLNILVASKSTREAESNFPRYLFMHKKNFVDIYNSLNQKKIKKLIALTFRLEKLSRKSGSVGIVLGLRFILNFKRVVFSASA